MLQQPLPANSVGPLTKKEMLSPYRDGLPTDFVRVARRCATWDLPRNFAGYQASDTHEMSIAGAATKCFLSKEGSLDGAYIAKFAHKNGEIETYTELFNNQLGLRLGFNMAHSGVARLDGVLHFLSRSFRTQPEQQLLHGSFLLQEIGLAEQAELDRINTAARQQGIFDVELVSSVISDVCQNLSGHVFEAFVEMLVFDALMGSMDRHPRNWGVLRSATLPAHYTFSPLYDSARALLWDYTDEKLKKLESDADEFQRYLLKSYPRIGLPQSEGCTGKCTHFHLITFLLKRFPEPTLKACEKIRVDVPKIGAHLLRQYPFRQSFSRRRRRLIVRVLTARRQSLLHLIR